MVEIKSTYEGDLHCVAIHGPSGSELPTDAPVDNQGRGAAFSPTDLVATALGTCILTTMAIYARRKQLPLEGARARVGKEMTTEGPRRIARLTVQVVMPLPADHPEARALVAAADTCPVKRSLHPDVRVETEWVWAG